MVKKWSKIDDFWRFLTKNRQKTRFLALNLQRKWPLRIYKENLTLKFAKFANEKNLQRKFCRFLIFEIYKENGSKTAKNRAARRTFFFVNFENRQFFPAGYRTGQRRTCFIVAHNSGPSNFPLDTIGFKVSLSPGLNRGFFARKFDIFVFGMFSFWGSPDLDFWSKMGHFWSIFDHFWSFFDHFSIIFRWFFDDFSIIFRSFFDHFSIDFHRFLIKNCQFLIMGGHFGVILAPKRGQKPNGRPRRLWEIIRFWIFSKFTVGSARAKNISCCAKEPIFKKWSKNGQKSTIFDDFWRKIVKKHGFWH